MQTDNINHSKPGAEQLSAPGFLRRIGAVIYDALLLLAVLFFATAIALPFNAGLAFASEQYYFPLYLFCVTYCFYAWFWTHGGQTLGMRAWKIRLVGPAGGRVSWRQATLRFFAALLSWSCLGLGFFWCLFDAKKRCWHDLLSKSYLHFVPDEKNSRLL
ncbi:MAG: RDD family protein [Methylomonas sp.]|nr:RDD family protein [Methylomonas sp.]